MKGTDEQSGAAPGTDEALRAPCAAQEIDATGLGTPARRVESDAGGPAPRHGQPPRPPTGPEAHDGRADGEQQHLPRLPTGPEAQGGRAGATGESVTEPSLGATPAVVGVHFADDAAIAEDFPVPQGTESSESDNDVDESAEDAVDGAVRSLKDTDTDKEAEAGPRFDRLLGSHPAGAWLMWPAQFALLMTLCVLKPPHPAVARQQAFSASTSPQCDPLPAHFGCGLMSILAQSELAKFHQ